MNFSTFFIPNSSCMIVGWFLLQAITPPNALQAPTTASTMPTAAAVAAAAATAKIQAMDAVASNAIVSGMFCRTKFY